MQYLVTADEMRAYEGYTIEEIGIPAMVLMERAAISCYEIIRKFTLNYPERGKRVLILSGTGNNGGDGLALARFLSENGYGVEIWVVGKEENASQQWLQQKRILQKYPVSFCDIPTRDEYTILVDALFGLGLKRNITGIYHEAVERFNTIKGYKIAVDLPSGIHSDDGRVMGIAVWADETVTFGFCKRGLALYPGCEYAGKVSVADIGIPSFCIQRKTPLMYSLDENPMTLLPKRKPDGNKGTFGKILLVAGSLNMAGAAVLAATAAYRTGVGMVKVISDSENRIILQQSIPEALFGTNSNLQAGLKWADVVVIGPGIGREQSAAEMLEIAIKESRLPILIDADGLNILACKKDLWEALRRQGVQGRKIILTPHVGELARLCEKEICEVKADLIKYGSALAMELQTVVVAKDARTFICLPDGTVCLNRTGNSGLAKAGSGDVLAGMIAGLIAQGMEYRRAACVGSYLHGKAGERASIRLSEYACMAGDLIEDIHIENQADGI